MRSSSVSSPQWMSSRTTTSGRCAAACSSVLRNAHADLVSGRCPSSSPTSERIVAATASSGGSRTPSGPRRLASDIPRRTAGSGPRPRACRSRRATRLRGGIADAGLADQRHEFALLLGSHSLPHVAKGRELGLPSDKPHDVNPFRRLVQTNDPVGRNRLRPALHRQSLDRLDLHGLTGEREREVAD